MIISFPAGGESPGRADIPADPPGDPGAAVPADPGRHAADADDGAAGPVLHLRPPVVDPQHPDHHRPLRTLRPAGAAAAVGATAAASPPPTPAPAAPLRRRTGSQGFLQHVSCRGLRGWRRRRRLAVAGAGAT